MAPTRRGGTGGRRHVSNEIGSRLRHARARKGLTLRGLARHLGVSPSLVSQIERGRVMPSVGTLFSMANELDLVVDDLFRDEEAGARGPRGGSPSPRDAGPVQRGVHRKTIRLAEGVRWERLTPASDAEVEFLYVTYDAGAASCREDSLVRHGGKEYAFLISGRLGITIGFDEFELRPGDSISFDAQTPHRLWTIGRKPAVAIWLVLNRHSDDRAELPDTSRAPARGRAIASRPAR